MAVVILASVYLMLESDETNIKMSHDSRKRVDYE